MQTSQLPAEVIRAVHQTEERSEVLISLFQVGFVVFMGVLYFLAPKGYTGDVPIRPVPLVLLAYTPLVLLRLGLAVRRALTPAMLVVSVVVDVAMVSVLLWSFHVQYQEELGLALKAPTAFYLFIFVALRSLRYDRRYVIFAGLTAAIAWMVLTGLAVYDGSGVTRDFVTYMTSTQVLVGAQVDRVIAILVMTAILAVGVSRAGTLLERSATESRARTELSRYFSPEIVTTILESQRRFSPGEGTVREAAILAVDLRGFTGWAQGVEPDVVMSTLAEYQERVFAVVLRHHGTVDKFMGDGVLCHFGAASEAPASTADALRCAEELREALRTWQQSLSARSEEAFEFGIGVADGAVIFGAVGSEDRLEFTVIGTPVNACAKLEKHTKACGAHIAVDLATYQRALEQGFAPTVPFEALPEERVEGLPEHSGVAIVGRVG